MIDKANDTNIKLFKKLLKTQRNQIISSQCVFAAFLFLSVIIFVLWMSSSKLIILFYNRKKNVFFFKVTHYELLNSFETSTDGSLKIKKDIKISKNILNPGNKIS
jgi:hypothetical protein